MPPPKPHIPSKLKAFVLGCDPTAFDKTNIAQGQEKPKRKVFEYVFDLGPDESKRDRRYFSGVLKNLEALGLGLYNVYVQNLVVDYQEKETSKNKKEWTEKAGKSIEARRKEFDKFDPSGRLPVFLTSYLLYEVLVNKGVELKTASQLYENCEVIDATDNQLNRPLVPLFRHYEYSAKNKGDYFMRMRDYFGKHL